MQHNTIYITDGSLPFGSRHDDQELKENVKSKWQVKNNANGNLCGNIRVAFINNIATLDEQQCVTTPSYIQISSALALYRSIALFECGLNVENIDFYKMNWEIVLMHKKSNIELALGEWKGGFQIFTPYHSLNDVDKQYKSDVEELLTLIVSPTMTIGYDGTIAGTVA